MHVALDVIIHLGADMFSDDGKSLAGGISHYARLEDAARLHKYVKSVKGYRMYWEGDKESLRQAAHDYLGHKFETF